jgi:hypothetical protein
VAGAGEPGHNGAAPADARAGTERLLDLFVFGPAELALGALRDLEHFDELAAKGREHFGMQLNNARVVGQLVVTTGRRRLEHLLGGLGPHEEPENVAAAPAAPARAAPARRPARPAADGASEGLAIPDYRALSASQVVRRLDGLGQDELEAVYRYETATRGRRTILHRAQQLLGLEEPPVPPAAD